jgi:hypothetical protein
MAIWTCLDAVVTLVTGAGVGSSPENRAVPAAGGGRQRVKRSEDTRFGSGSPLQTGWETRLVGTQNGGRTFVKAVAHATDVKRGRFDPVHHLWFGSSQRPRRGRIPWVVFRGVIWDDAVRYNVSIELQRVFVCDMSPGARL